MTELMDTFIDKCDIDVGGISVTLGRLPLRRSYGRVGPSEGAVFGEVRAPERMGKRG